MMAWTDHLRPARWMTTTTTKGSGFFRSRAGARWVAALIAASFILFVMWVYHNEIYPDIAGTTAASLQQLLPIGGGGGGGGGKGSGTPAQTTSHRLPAWIDTPAVFDISQVPGYVAATAATAALDSPPALHPRVAEAVERFLARPVLSHEQAAAQNEAACPRAQLDKQVNEDQLRSERENWLAVDGARVVAMRRAAVAFLEARSKEDGEGALMGPGLGPEGKVVEKGSRGVVIAAGNHRTVERAVICVKEMQRLGWKGPVEVWHFEGELGDEKDRETLRGLGVAIHMVSLWCECEWPRVLCSKRAERGLMGNTGLYKETARPVEEFRAQGRGHPPQLVRRGAVP